MSFSENLGYIVLYGYLFLGLVYFTLKALRGEDLKI